MALDMRPGLLVIMGPSTFSLVPWRLRSFSRSALSLPSFNRFSPHRGPTTVNPPAPSSTRSTRLYRLFKDHTPPLPKGRMINLCGADRPHPSAAAHAEHERSSSLPTLESSTCHTDPHAGQHKFTTLTPFSLDVTAVTPFRADQITITSATP